jgi:hypothetical protein
MAPHIFDPGTRYNWVVSLPLGNSPPTSIMQKFNYIKAETKARETCTEQILYGHPNIAIRYGRTHADVEDMKDPTLDSMMI